MSKIGEGKLAAIACRASGPPPAGSRHRHPGKVNCWLGEAELNTLLEAIGTHLYARYSLLSPEALGIPAQTREQGYATDSEERAGRALRGSAGVEPRIPRDCRPEPVDADLAWTTQSWLISHAGQLQQAGSSSHARWATRPEPLDPARR